MLEVATSSSGLTSDVLYLSNLNSATSTAARLSFRTQDTVNNTGTTTAALTSILQQNFTTGKGDLAFSTLRSGALTEAMRILDSGNVGIGTTTPSGNLVINGTTGKNLFQIATSTNQGIVMVDENGRIGIGTTSPLQLLDVTGGATDVASFGSTAQRFYFRPDTNGISMTSGLNQAGQGIYANNTDSSLQLFTGGSSRVTIESDGDAIFSAGVSVGGSLGYPGAAASTGNEYICAQSTGGAFTHTLSVAGSACTPSDQRLKENIFARNTASDLAGIL